MNDVTIVSALFNIKREGMDGRKWEEYLKWFDITLKLKCPMVLFITEDVREFVEERRLSIPTTVIIQTVEDMPYYHLKDKIDGIIGSEEYSNKIADPDRIECQHALYSIVQYSKFKWLDQAIEENPYGSKHFFWLDAGGSRFFEDYDLNKDYPSPNAIESLNEMGDSFLIQMNMEFYKDLAGADELPKEYLLDNRSFILGSMFGGGPESIKKVSKLMEEVFVDEMIGNGYVNNEQIAFGYLVKKNPDDFAVFERYNGKHMELFTELGKR